MNREVYKIQTEVVEGTYTFTYDEWTSQDSGVRRTVSMI